MNTGDVLYDVIGSGYNTTRAADPYITQKLFQLLLPQTGKLYLDVGCGTGNYTIALANKELDFYGVEPSENMLKAARAKNQHITWLLGTAESIPVSNELFDGAIATLTIHHWTDLESAFNEIYRVLKPGAKIVIFTATPNQMKKYWLNHYFPKMMAASILQMPAFNEIEETAVNTNFKIIGTERYMILDDLQDLFLYSGKNKPEYYLNEEIRKGISSFASLANAEEIIKGLSVLEQDIRSGEFERQKNKFENDLGDYLFITVEKR